MVYKDQSTFSAAGKCAAENQRSLRFKQVFGTTDTDCLPTSLPGR